MDRRAHMTDRDLYTKFYDIDTTPGWGGTMPPEEPRLAWALRHIKPEDWVIDIGCHKGEMTSQLAKATSGRVVGVDIAQHAVDYNRKHRSEFVCYRMDAEQLGLPDGGFDVAILSEILEHVIDPEAAVREAERVTKPGGTIVISVPVNAFEMDRQEAPERDKLGLALDMHVREYEPEKLFADRPGFQFAIGGIAGTSWKWRLASFRVEK